MHRDETRRRAATRTDVAKLAGVSSAVVSYVVNGGPRPVARDTQQRVLDAIQVLGYRPNASARALKLGSTNLIGIVAPMLSNPFYAEFIDQINIAASKRGHALLLTTTQGDPESERQIVTDLVNRGVDGLLFLVFLHDENLYSLRSPEIPRVLLDRSQPIPGFQTIGSGIIDGSRMATQYLLDHGATSVTLIAGELDAPRIDLRRIGWEQALHAAGIVVPEPYITTWDQKGGYHAAEHLLRLADRHHPLAIFAGSDLIAMGAVQAIHDMGLSIPDDVQIISFDGTSIARYSWPALTAVRHPFSAMAEAALNTVLDTKTDNGNQIFPMSLVTGFSCA
ncbi:LacI family DNA-binding transcriptional regulator [Bifidobacterium sp.]|nr:LacI family DNA-binding transcriptional regulator [Bifidobacterium sp.]MCI1224713.1 LacI family transcriptional regulator [Bifidobacterium sp.]